MAVSKINSNVAVTKKAVANGFTIPTNGIYTGTITVSDAVYGIVKGFAITANANSAVVQCYFSNATTITFRVRGLSDSTSIANMEVYYC